MDPQSPQTPQAPQQPVYEMKNKGNKSIFIIIAVLVLLTVGAGGMYFFMQQNKQRNSTLPIATTMPQPTQNILQPTLEQPSPTTQIDETAGWKIYQDEGFSFKYPNDLYGIDISGFGTQFYLSKNIASQSKVCFENQSGTLDKPCNLGMIFSIYLKTFNIAQYTSIPDLITKEQLDLFEPKKLIDPNNREWTASVAFEANGHYFTSAYLSINDKLYYVSIATPMGELAKYKFKQDYDHKLYTDGSYYNAATEFTKKILFSVEIK